MFQNGVWSVPMDIIRGSASLENQLPCWNPVLFKERDKKLLLFYKVGKNPREWWGMVMRSSDLGKGWSQPQALPNGFLGPIKNKPLQLSDGTILCPSSTESNDGRWAVHIELTDAKLSCWKKVTVETDTGVGVIQPAILQHPNGRLQMLCRSRQNYIYQSWSSDQGIHWSKLSASSLPNPNSGIDAVSLENGSYMLIYNPLPQGKEWFLGRNVLAIALSTDGVRWENQFQIENENEGEYSYPAVIQAADKSIHITYTCQRKTIKHIVVRLTT
jgi:alpha-L-fucosidase